MKQKVEDRHNFSPFVQFRINYSCDYSMYDKDVLSVTLVSILRENSRDICLLDLSYYLTQI